MDNYNIDDILSEVKKRRMENEAEIKGEPKIDDSPAPKPEPKPAPAEEPVAPTADAQPIDDGDELVPATAEVADEAPAEAEENGDAMVDLFSFSEEKLPDDEYDDYLEADPIAEKAEAKKKKTKKIVRNVIIIILVIALILGGGAGIYIWRAMNQITEPSPKTEVEDNWSMDELVENYVPITEAEASEVASFQEMIKKWYYNGAPSSSSHVFNVLLVGTDTRGDEIKDSGTRADSAMICSVNIDTKTIHLTSVLRDTWAYWENEPGNPDSGMYNKINGAMSKGDINVYKNAVENLYKVKIDNYVIVNFDSFKKIIDVLGGVTLEITSAEIREINNHPKRYGNVTIEKTFDGNKGEMKLNGEQALAYCRIRKLDSDNMRANRQKICLTKVAEQAKGASLTTLLKLVDTMIPYVKTDMSSKRILKIAKYALSEGWLDYEVSSMNIPDARINERGAGSSFAFTGRQWVWKSDFPADAYTVQMKIYGQSPITLAHERVDIINCRETGEMSDGIGAVTATMTNYHYGEATTRETTTKKESTTKAE